MTIPIELLPRSGSEGALLGPDGFSDVGEGPGSDAGKDIDFLTISDQEGAVVDDVERIRNHPLVPRSIPIHGSLYHVRSGRLIEVEQASKTGAAT